MSCERARKDLFDEPAEHVLILARMLRSATDVGEGQRQEKTGSRPLAVDNPKVRYLFRAWTLPTLEQAGLIVAVGLIAAVGFTCISQAHRLGRAGVVAPFEYSSLPFTALWGWLFWSSVPTTTTLIGSALIVGSGIYVMRRELVANAPWCAAPACGGSSGEDTPIPFGSRNLYAPMDRWATFWWRSVTLSGWQ